MKLLPRINLYFKSIRKMQIVLKLQLGDFQLFTNHFTH